MRRAVGSAASAQPDPCTVLAASFMGLEAVEAPEVTVDLLGEGTLGLAPTVGREVGPEQRVGTWPDT